MRTWSPTQDGSEERLKLNQTPGSKSKPTASAKSQIDDKKRPATDWCLICQQGGKMIACNNQKCNSGVHLYCLGIKSNDDEFLNHPKSKQKEIQTNMPDDWYSGCHAFLKYNAILAKNQRQKQSQKEKQNDDDMDMMDIDNQNENEIEEKQYLEIVQNQNELQKQREFYGSLEFDEMQIFDI